MAESVAAVCTPLDKEGFGEMGAEEGGERRLAASSTGQSLPK
jgi:hypothetical protein